MNVLQLISSVGFFGAENVMYELAAELAAQGRYHPVAGVIENLGNPHREVADKCREQGMQTVVFPCGGKFDYTTLARIRSYIKKNNIGIIHSHGYKANLYSFFASRGLSKPLIATCHNWLGDAAKMRFYAALDRFVLRRFDAIAAVSEPVKEQIVAGGVSADKVRIVQNGISLKRFDAAVNVKEIRAALGLGDDRIVVGTVGRLSPEKGHEHLLCLAEEIAAKHPKCVFLVIGDGDLREKLQRKYGSPSVLFTGVRNDVPLLYRCMDIFVLPSLTEGLPIVLLEAMASQLPIIATKVGAVPLVVKDRDTGLLVEPGDRNALKTALLYYLENPERAKAIGSQGKLTVERNYSSKKMTDDYTRIYEQIGAGGACMRAGTA